MFIVKDINKNKTSITNQFFAILFSIVAIRTYPPAYSILGVLFLFILFYNKTRILRYSLILFIILISQFPIFEPLSASKGVYHLNFWSITKVFSNNFLENVFNPLPNMSNLYYKSFYDIISFFGIWFIIILLVLVVLKKTGNKHLFNLNNTNKNNLNTRLLYSLTIAWMFSELPTYIFLLENAIRYITTLMIPFSLFVSTIVCSLLQKIKPKYKKIVGMALTILIACTIIINSSYTYAFRAGWGSSFTAFEHVMNFFAEQHNKNTGVLYYSSAVADEYKSINKKNTDYQFGKNITYLKSSNLKDFSKNSITSLSKKYGDFYVLKRTTSVSKTSYPEIDIETISELKLVRIINGIDCKNMLFDRINLMIIKLFNIKYHPNKVYIYKFNN